MNRDNSYLKGNKHAAGSGANETSFKKGSKPWNRGLTHSEEARKKIRLARKKQVGANHPSWVPVGTVRQRKDKNGTRRNWIKIAEPKKWRELSHHIWEKAGRKFVKGMCLHHVNNRSDDDRLENLIIVSRRDHPKLHSRWNTKN